MNFLKIILIYLRTFILWPKALKLRRSKLFSNNYYLETYNDIEDGFLLPELHFLQHGMYEQRNPHPIFDTAYYIAQVPFFFSLKTDPVTHFLTVGAAQGINPHPLFNVNFYTKYCPSICAENPLEHYLSQEASNKAEPNPLFFSTDYKKIINVSSLNDVPLLHYINKNLDIRPFSLPSLERANQQQHFQCYIERFSTFESVLFISGWAFAPEKSIAKIGYLNAQGSIAYLPWPGLPSNELCERFGSSAAYSRFDLKLFKSLPENHLDIVLVFQFSDGAAAYEVNLARYGLRERPHATFIEDIFLKMLHEDQSPARILEIGSRNRSGFASKEHIIPDRFHYTGTDIMAGDNVDIVCDAHELSSFFPHQNFDYVFSLNVFEHLLVPWKVALEINHLLKIGGKVMIFTHHE